VLRKFAPPGALIQRESKKKRKARMEKQYGVKLTGELSDSMLKKLDEILSLLPRSHTKGNASLKEITGGGGIGGNASAYDSTAKRLEMNTPEITSGVKMPVWLYLLLSKGSKWQRAQMDEGAMSDFDIDSDKDKQLGLDAKGKREVMAGVSDVLSREKLVDWTIRHEAGHSVDEQIGFTTTRAKLPQFGGWRTYDHKKPAQAQELATVFLLKAGFTQTDIAKKLPKKVDAAERTVTDMLSEMLAAGKPGIVDAWADPIAGELKKTKAEVLRLLAAVRKSVEVGMAHPWTFSDGGGDLVKHGDRMYHRDHYGTWVSYLADARANALSNYHFSSPGEWFAETYAAVYDPRPQSAARDRLTDPVRSWFIQNLGPPSTTASLAEKSTGKLEDKQGNLQSLKDLDDAVFAALSDPARSTTVKLSDLPPDLQDDTKRLAGF
jgi:hypothetical protein